ncbi:insulinase family protein [Desulfovibrio sp.]|uniref:insulinase family protein n=1 Tax=Desulfovibrio sp. TaxID=885 RepID=UPI0023D1D131|nr:insulinase family protein [Desulfovibrio sp.]MDE7240475.1 insulinase family protein [Desulfovibrio sp.]
MARHGFTLAEERQLPEVGGTARLWRHDATGAELLSIVNADENKCFGVSFRTPPADSTGVAHILEHSVLCGSERYPVKEPFVELLKGSLQTFLNAFTFPDKTCYPVASANLQDFYNLIDVYLDAVFHPRISEDIFRQEGWHVEAGPGEAPWTYKGVVYNEMKGAYSSPDSVLAEKSQQAVFPDTLYSLDSGGDPERIPDLSYAAFREFHRRHYQPGNARFFFWGDDPEDERLARIDAELQRLASRAPEPADEAVPLQKRLAAPRRVEVPYAAAPGETRALFTVNWLLGERGDVAEALLMEMLEHILEGLPGSPLRLALISSGLGEDTTGCGLETDLRQMYYSTGLKGVALEDVPRAEALILDTLRGLAENGIPREAVEAAVNSVEFAYRENNSGRFPRGLAAMIQALSTWLYGGDPLAPLAWEAPLQAIKARIAAGEPVFEEALARNFLDNPHRAHVVLLPDAKLGETRLAAEAARLEALRAGASPRERARIEEETRRLEEAQAAPDSPEALATIPALGLSDLPPRNKPLPLAERSLPQTALAHELPTAGIAYASLLLPVTRLPERLLPLLPLFCRALTETGTARRDMAALGAHMAAKTGGVGATPLTGLKLGSRETFCHVALSGKAVYDKIPDLFAIMEEVLLEPARDSDMLAERLGQMLLEEKARLEYGIQAAGHATVSARLRARYTGEGALAERLAGLSYLESVRALLGRLEEAPESVLADLEELRRRIVTGGGVIFDCTAEAEGLALAESHAASLLARLPGGSAPADGVDIAAFAPMTGLPRAEALITPAQVNYVGKAANLYDLGYAWHGSASVILRYLRMGRLWDEVRVRGGAYGVFCNLDRVGGTLVCASYRDPNVERTIAAYDGLADFLRGVPPDRARLTQAIVGAVGDLDAYLLPDARGARALGTWLSGNTEVLRQRTREEMLATTAEDFVRFADTLEKAAEAGEISVLGGPKAEAAARAGGWASRNIL